MSDQETETQLECHPIISSFQIAPGKKLHSAHITYRWRNTDEHRVTTVTTNWENKMEFFLFSLDNSDFIHFLKLTTSFNSQNESCIFYLRI